MRRLVLPLVIVVLLILGAGGGFFAGKFLHPDTSAPATLAPAAPVTKPAPDADLLYDLPDMLVAIEGDASSDHVLVISITLQCATQADVETLQKYLPRVLDAFQGYLRTLTIADLRGTKNLETIRAGLVEHADKVIAPGRVSNVLIRGMTVR